MRTVITFGTFDVLHIGHIKILERAKKYGDRLIVGVSSDALSFSKSKDTQFTQKMSDVKLFVLYNMLMTYFLRSHLN
ncbi:Glycerol-3-phosphate cytidylyltransferase [Escherichia coli]|uniref:adenylyltransferase/cytidyltransferase family protein n=1 Tax=Escherichia coli TaxID=562 RepID=UPI000F2B1481|nr:Glycerol-3-phosphate cytidylyltransferase [Escherichia coli]